VRGLSRADKSTPDARFLPVTFEQNCKSCHARELEFDVYHVGRCPARAACEGHEGHPRVDRLRLPSDVLARIPPSHGVRWAMIWSRRPNNAAWLAKVVKDSEVYLF